MRRLTILLIAIVVALWAESVARAEDTVLRDAVLLYLLAGGLFVAAARPPAPWPALGPRPAWRPRALTVAAVGIGLGLLALLGFWLRKDVYTGWPLVLWLLGIALTLVGAWLDGRGRPAENPRPPRPAYGPRAPLDRRTEIALLLLILVVALFLRAWHLDTIPNGCQSDECNNALDALRWLRGEPYVPYAGTNEGQATLFTYIIAGLFALFGPSIVTLRLAPALVGTVTVLAFYLLARWRFDSPRLALALAAMLAASRWHLTFSRIVYELIMVPLVVALLLWALLRALRHGRRFDWALVGVLLALGMNTYTAFRVVPFWIALFFLYWLAGDFLHEERRGQLLRDIEGMALALAAFVVAFAPLGVYTLRHWDQFTARIRHISVFNDIQAAGSYEPLKQNLIKALKMFNVQGDLAPLNNLPGEPMLNMIVGALFVLGLIYVLRYLNRPLPFLYVTGVLFQLSTVVLSVAHEAPSARRPIGILVIVYLLVGEVLYQVWDAFAAAWRAMGRRIFEGVLASLAVLLLVWNGNLYFGVQATLPQVQLAYSPHESAVGTYIRTLPEDALVLVTTAYNHHSAVKFLGGREVIPLNLSQHVPLREQVNKDVVYILDPPLRGVIPFLEKVYPDGEVNVHRGPADAPMFISFHVPAANMDRIRGLKARYYAGDQPAGAVVAERTVRTLDLTFAEGDPLPRPYTVELSGALLVPAAGAYLFDVQAQGGQVSVFLNDRCLGECPARVGAFSTEKRLVAGFASLRILFTLRDPQGMLRVQWGPSGDALRPLSVPDLYAIDVGPNGLIGYYYPNATWEGPPSVIERDFFIIPNNILREPYSIRWRGKIAIPTDGVYRFATRSDDGSFVYVDGRLIVDNGGVHGMQIREGSIELTRGFHDLEVWYFQQGGASEMTFLWIPPGGAQEIVPLDYLFPVEEEEIPETLLPPPPQVGPPSPPPEEVGPVVSPPAPPVEGVPLPRLEMSPLWTVGECGDGDGRFDHPRGLAVAPDGRIFVADTGNKRIVVLSPQGQFLTAWGEAGEGTGQFVEPFEVAVDKDGTVWVLDSVRQLLLHFDDGGQFLEEVAPTSPWYRPRGLALASDGTFYVADTGLVRVVQVARDGTLIRQIGGKDGPIGPGQPTDVAVAADGSLYVVEAQSGVLWHLDAEGVALAAWSVPKTNTIDAPHLDVLPDGRVMVTSPSGPTVQVYEGDGTPVGEWGGAEMFGLPVGIALAPDGRLVAVSDSAMCRVLVFSWESE